MGGGEGGFEQDLEMSSLFVLLADVKQILVTVRDTEYGGMLADRTTLAGNRDPSSLERR